MREHRRRVHAAELHSFVEHHRLVLHQRGLGRPFPNFAGLGVGNGSPSDDDQILNGDKLTIKFDTSVQLKGVGTLFDPGHNPFGAFDAGQITGAMGIIINGVFHSLLSANFDALVGLGLVGDTFTFEWAGVGNPGFDVSALDYTKGAITQTPLPPAALLFGTALAGLGILGVLAAKVAKMRWRRSNRKNSGA